MPFELQRIADIVSVRFRGTVSTDDLAKAVQAIAADPLFTEQRFHIVDFTAATLPVLDHRVLNAMAPAIGATLTNSSIDTVFVPDGPGTRAFVDHCQVAFSGLRSVSFCENHDAAFAWAEARAVRTLLLEAGSFRVAPTGAAVPDTA